MWPSSEKKPKMEEKKNILVGCTGSVASVKLPGLVKKLFDAFHGNVEISVVVTKYASHFFDKKDVADGVKVYTDDDEWEAWKTRGDPILHIELGKWADILVIAPLDCNTLGKIAQGLCDNLLTCVVRAWDVKKPLFFCPAMNTRMWEHPITPSQIETLKSWGYREVPCISKTLMCGDCGLGGMAEVEQIVESVVECLNE